MSSGKYCGPSGNNRSSSLMTGPRFCSSTALIGTYASKSHSEASTNCSVTSAGEATSTLFTAHTVGVDASSRRPATRRSPGPIGAVASITNTTASASLSEATTRSLRRFPKAVRGRWTPGVSTSTTCRSGRCTTPRITLRVVCGRSEVMVTLVPTNALIRVLLPTLGRPTTGTNPDFTRVPRESEIPVVPGLSRP